MSSRREEVASEERANRQRGWLRRALDWTGENFAKALIGAIATALVSAAIAYFVTEDQVPSAHKAKSHISHNRARFDSWPDGVSAWTVVLASEASKGLAESAVEKAKRIASHGLNIGVLHSDDYSSLQPGFWVAFAGQFDSVDEAQQAADRYRSQFPTAYQRFIEQG
jgi:hypothetical protein